MWSAVGYLLGFFVLFQLLCMVSLQYVGGDALHTSPTVVDPMKKRPPTRRATSQSTFTSSVCVSVTASVETMLLYRVALQVLST